MARVKAILRGIPWRAWIAFAALVGVFAGIGGFTFTYAEGLSYFSNDPQACINCHLMEEYLDSWQHSSHHAVAVCNDCHTPHDLPNKLLTKADNGFFHSLSFTFHLYPDNLRIREVNRRKLRANCVGCHHELVDPINEVRALPDTAQGQRPDNAAPGPHSPGVDCLHCHNGVGHGPRK